MYASRSLLRDRWADYKVKEGLYLEERKLFGLIGRLQRHTKHRCR